MPISIIENFGRPNQVQLTNQADGFIFWFDFTVNAVGNPTIGSAFLGLLYDASRLAAPIPLKPTPGATSYRFQSGGIGSIDFNQTVLHPTPTTGSPSRRCISAVFSFTAGGGPMARWLNSAAWGAVPPRAGYNATFDPRRNLGFDPQYAAWGPGGPRFVFRLEPTSIGGNVDSLGIIAPLLSGPMIQSFYNLLNGVVPPGAAAGAVVPALDLRITGNHAFNILGPTNCQGFAMIAHGVLAPGVNEYFPFSDWRALTADELVRRVAEKSYTSPGVGAPPNDDPVEIIYLEGLAGMGLGGIPTY